MSYRPDDYDLELSYELERKLDRDFEREPHRRHRQRRPVSRRYFSGLLHRPAANANSHTPKKEAA